MNEHAPKPRSFLRRMLVRKLWRAFPELDAYSDEECIAFVKLARSRVLWRLMQLAVVGAVFAGTAVALLLAAGFITQLVQANAQWIPDAAFVALGIGGVIVVPATSITSAFLARDFLLRRRLRHILRDTGSCTMCGYSLVGLPIPDSLKVNCPECGYLCAVDVSLSVLERDDAGEAVGRRVVMQRPRYWTPERKRFWKRLSLGTVGAIIVLAGVPLATYEIWLRMQAAQARADMPTIEEATALIARHRPGLELVKHPVAFDLLLEVGTRMRTIERKVRAEGAHTPGTWYDFACIVPDPLPGQPGTDSTLTSEPVRQSTERLFAAHDDAELDALFADLRAAPRQVKDSRTPTPGLTAVHRPYLVQARQAAMMLAARARQAIMQRDTATAERCLATIRALHTHVCDQATLIDRLVAHSLEAVGRRCVNRWLASKPSAEELDAIERAWGRTENDFDALLSVDFEALAARAAIAEVFEDPGNVRFAPLSGFQQQTLVGGPAQTLGTVGTWAANRDAIERERLQLALRLALSVPERLAAVAQPYVVELEGAPLADLFLGWGLPGGDRHAWMDAAIEAQRCVTTLMLALERYRVKQGDYPAELSSLVPEFLAELPRDPTTGSALGFTLVDADTDPLGRNYLIYLFGRDGEDNHGREPYDFFGKHEGPLLREHPLEILIDLPFDSDVQVNIAAPILRDSRLPVPASSAPPAAPPPDGEIQTLETILPLQEPERPISPSSAPAR